MAKILVTGTAGFIGYHLTKRLTLDGNEVVGLDVVNEYYDVKLKHARLVDLGFNLHDIRMSEMAVSHSHPQLRFIQMDLANHQGVVDLMGRKI